MADDRTYIRVHDGMPDHPKIAEAGGDAGWLWVCGLAYCSRHLTDGLIPKAIVPRLSDRRQPERLAAALVRVGLWEHAGEHYRVHDYTEHQRTAEEVAELKAKRREAGARGGKERAKREANRKQVLEQEPEQVLKQTPKQVLKPSGSKSQPSTETETDNPLHHPQTDPGSGPLEADDDGKQQLPRRNPSGRLARARAACELIGQANHDAALAAGTVRSNPAGHRRACIQSAEQDYLVAAQLAAHQDRTRTPAELAELVLEADHIAAAMNGNGATGPPLEPPAQGLYEAAEARRLEHQTEGPADADFELNKAAAAAARSALREARSTPTTEDPDA